MQSNKYKRYKATRTIRPHLTARAVLNLIRQQHKSVTEYMPGTIYNPQIEGTKKRWIEDTDKAGLRFVKFADEIVRLDHNGWFNHYDQGCADLYRGAIYQLPAHKGQPIYVCGYQDTWSGAESAALIDFDYQAGAPGGLEETGLDDLGDLAHYADDMAERDAEENRTYSMKADAKIRAEELREEAKTKRTALCVVIREARARIQELRDEAQSYIDEPWTIANGF